MANTPNDKDIMQWDAALAIWVTCSLDTAGFVDKSLFDANTILAANSDNTPAALIVAEQTVIGRLTGGNIDDIAIGIADNNIVQIDQADTADNDYAKFTTNGLEGRSYAEVKTDLELTQPQLMARSLFR